LAALVETDSTNYKKKCTIKLNGDGKSRGKQENNS